jgi:hypothetical protein
MHVLLGLLMIGATAACTRSYDFDVVWVAGDVHVHSSTGSNDTDGVSFEADIAAAAQAAGLGFVVITDHSNSTGSMHCEDVEDCPNLGPEFPAIPSTDGTVLVVGNELSPLFAGHVGCLPPDGGFAFEGAFVDRPEGEVTAADIVGQCRDAGGWSVANHPFGVPWIAWDGTTQAYDAMEVWNGGWRWDASDVTALAAWECAVAMGRHVVPIAASDNHRVGIVPPGAALDPPLGQPRTSVALLPEVEPSWPAIRRALQAGRVVLHEDDTWVEASALSWAPKWEEWDLSGESPGPGTVQLRAIPSLETCDLIDPEPVSEVLWSAEVDGSFELSTDRLEHAPDVSRKRYLALVPSTWDEPGAGGVALTGLLEVPPG